MIDIYQLETGDAISVSYYKGISFRVDQLVFDNDDDKPSRVLCHMIGDNKTHTVDVDDIELLDDEAYCHECGQIGCTHDGIDRS